jgi:hypothetical protein
VQYRRKALIAFLFTLITTSLAIGQEILLDGSSSESEEEFIPSPLDAFSRPTFREFEASQAAEAGIESGIRRLPPLTVVEEIPLPDIAPSAIEPFSFQAREARLVRGNEVVALSNSALRASGVFEMAPKNSTRLAQSYQLLEFYTLQVQQYDIQLQQEMQREQAARNEANADLNNVELRSQADAQKELRQNVEMSRSLARNAQIEAEAQFE